MLSSYSRPAALLSRSSSSAAASALLPLCSPAAAAVAAASVSFSRSLHTSSLHSVYPRVTEEPRPIPRPSHFHPPVPGKIVPHPSPHPPKIERDPHAAKLVKQFDTHTVGMMKRDAKIKMQFQLEPLTRTNVKVTGLQGRISDYTSSEIFTRAPWPSYREIVLNRPGKRHALNLGAVQQLSHMLMAMDHNKDIAGAVLMPHHPPHTDITKLSNRLRKLEEKRREQSKKLPYEKTFCAGIDFFALIQMIESTRAVSDAEAPLLGSRHPRLSEYFKQLYQLSFDMSRVRVPFVTVLDGLCIGAGAGFAMQGRFRSATENTAIRFPQVSLGWFPDAGAMYTLSHMDAHVGYWLALTGATVRGYDAVRLGLATHYTDSDEVWRFGKRIGDAGPSQNYQFAEDTVEQTFGMFGESKSLLPLPLHQLHHECSHIFSADSIEEVFLRIQRRLDAQSSGDTKVAQFLNDTVQRLVSASPLSLKVTFAALKLAQFLPLERCLQLEYRLAQKLLCNLADPRNSDLYNAPKWRAQSLKDVTNEDVRAILAEDQNPTREMRYDYPPKKERQWDIGSSDRQGRF